MNASESPPPRPKLARMAIAAFCFIGMAAIVGWSLPERLAGPRAEVATRPPAGERPGMAVERPGPVQVTRNARRGVNCDGCGVIESVRRIDMREEFMEWCAIGDTAAGGIPGTAILGDDRNELASLADTATGVIAGDQRARKFRVTTRHQIVVRFRDGSRQVFNESSPRTLREGDRIMVIAGSTEAKG